MSLHDMLLTGINNIQSNDELRGAFQHILGSAGLHPSVDVVDTPNNLYVYVEIPGVSEESITVDFFNTNLTVSGEKLKRYTAHPYKTEILYGKFTRKIMLPIGVTNQANVDVKYTNGILMLTVDKRREESNKFTVRLNNKVSEVL